MLAPAHRQAAGDIEAALPPLQADQRFGRVTVESAWGAAFHWIAFGCQTKHSSHQESHARLATFLRTLGEPAVAQWWEQLERLRQGAWYGNQVSPAAVAQALDLLREVRTWATT